MRKLIAIILTISLASPMWAASSLTFTAATTNKVELAATSDLDTMSVGTILAWIRPTVVTTAAGNKVVLNKFVSGPAQKFIKVADSLDGSLDFGLGRGTGGVQNLLIRSATGFITTNEWQFVGAVWDASLTDADQKLFRGTLTGPVIEPTYAAQQVGTGTVGDDSADQVVLGNTGVALQRPLAGQIAWVGIWNRALTQAEIHDQQYTPHVTSGNVLFMNLGFNDTGTQYDLSGNGNNGTVTGAAVSSLGPPITFPQGAL